jgi:hypothetical protein
LSLSIISFAFLFLAFDELMSQTESIQFWVSYWRRGRAMAHYVSYTNDAGGSVEEPVETVRAGLVRLGEFALFPKFREGGLIEGSRILE